MNRWIFLPLLFALINAFIYAIFFPNALVGFSLGFFIGAVMGLILQLWSELRFKKLFNNTEEKDFSIRQKRNFTLLQDIDSAYDSCREAVSEIGNIKIKNEVEPTFIKAQSGFNFHSFGTEIKINLSPINENLTEIEISTAPALKTTLVDYGESLRIIEELCLRLKEKDSQINNNKFIESGDPLDEIYVNQFETDKEKIEIPNQ